MYESSDWSKSGGFGSVILLSGSLPFWVLGKKKRFAMSCVREWLVLSDRRVTEHWRHQLRVVWTSLNLLLSAMDKLWEAGGGTGRL